MAKSKKKGAAAEQLSLPPAPVEIQPITETIEKNYMPYAMSVIISRAIPEIDGLKPAHRKLLYTMYKMGLITGSRTKSAHVVGQTMTLHPHGDAAIYDTMVRLTRGNATLLHPLVDSKGSFGKRYSSTMVCAAPRYTEVKLEQICNELFRGIDKDAVDMVDNYDGTVKEPTLLPTSFPNILVMPNSGIAVSMASEIPSFNLAEICDGTIALLKKPNLPIEKFMEIVKAPDFSDGGILLYDEAGIRKIYETGQGSIPLRARYNYDKQNNCIDIIQIPYATTLELIMKKLTDLAKAGKLKEVSDFRDEIDISGFKLTLDLRNNVNPDKLMNRLFHCTPLQCNFNCNINVLIDSVPRTIGVMDLLREWIRFRMGCVRRELTFDLKKKQDKLHLLLGLAKVLADIDKAIRIIRKTEQDEMVIPNLMAGFDIDEIQANYIADIKLRNLNRRYILDRISEVKDLESAIEEINALLTDDLKLKAYIAKQLADVKQKYGQPRRTMIIGSDSVEAYIEEPSTDNTPVRLVMTREGYFKKLSMRPNVAVATEEQHKLKEGDSVLLSVEAKNTDELIFFSDRAQMYRARVSDFDQTKASLIGDFLPIKLGMEDGERPLMMNIQNSFPAHDHIVVLFQNGKGVRISLSAYETKAYRKKLTGAYSDVSPAVAVLYEKANKPLDLLLITSDRRAILMKSSLIPEKATRTSQGVQVVTLRPKATLSRVVSAPASENTFENVKGYRKIKIPSATTELKTEDFSGICDL